MGAQSPEISVDAVSGALLEAVKSAVEKDQSPWSDLIAGLEADLTNKVRPLTLSNILLHADVNKIREHAERELLNASTFLSSSATNASDRSYQEDEAFIHKYLTVIDFTASEILGDNQAPIFVALVERLKGIADALSKYTEASKPIAQTENATSTSVLCSW